MRSSRGWDRIIITRGATACFARILCVEVRLAGISVLQPWRAGARLDFPAAPANFAKEDA